MTSNLYRYTILGELLVETQNELNEKKGLRAECSERIKEKFDEIANKHICKDENKTNKSNPRPPNPAQIGAIEHEFKFHDGVWSFQLTDVVIKMECEEIATERLKGNFCILRKKNFYLSNDYFYLKIFFLAL